MSLYQLKYVLKRPSTKKSKTSHKLVKATLGTSVVDLADKVFSNSDVNASTQLECVNCQFLKNPKLIVWHP